MYSANVDYYRAKTVDEAIKLLKKNPGSKLLAGGHSLIPAMKLRVKSWFALGEQAAKDCPEVPQP